MQKTKLLVIAITTAAIIAAVTTTSLSAATPAFAKRNCNEDGTICSGGSGCGVTGCTGGTSSSDIPGGGGGHGTTGAPEQTFSGGGGQNDGTFVGGTGRHTTCDAFGCQTVGGSGFHVQGPGGNSGNAPPP
jgi:hypothetical protein